MVKINTTSRMYEEINESVRKHWGFTKEEFYHDDTIPLPGIDPDRMMITDYSPDYPSWHGKICIVFGGKVNFFTILLHDSRNDDWRVVTDVEWKDNRELSLRFKKHMYENKLVHADVL